MDSSFGTRTKKDKTFDNEIKEIQKKIREEPKNRFLNKDYCKQMLKKPSHTNVIVALESIEKFLEFKPDNLEANVLKARALRLLQRNDDALSILEVMKHNEEDDQQEIEEEIGRNWLDQNKVSNAKKVLKQAYKKFPKNNRIGRALVLCYEQTGEMEIALHHTNLLLRENPEDEKSINNKIFQLRTLDRWKEAVETGEEVMEKNPEIFFDIGFDNENQVVGIFLGHARTHFLYGVEIDSKNKHNQILLRNKEKIIITVNISNEAKLHFKKCLQICDEFIYRITDGNQNINEKNLVRMNELKVNCYSKIREFDKAILLCNEMLIHKKTIPILYAKGFALMHLQRYKEALEMFEMALKDYPMMKNADINRLIAIKKLHSESEFEEEYQKFNKKYGKKVEKKVDKEITLESNEEEGIEDILERGANFHLCLLENKLRDFIFKMWDNDEKQLFGFLKGSCKSIFDHMMEQKQKDMKFIHEIPKNSPMRYATLGELYAILDSGKVKKILKKEIENMDDFKNHFQIVLEYRNFQDHAKELNMDTGELQHHEKMLLVGACIATTKALNNFPKIIINRDSTD